MISGRRLCVDDAGLGTDMDLTMGCVAFCQHQHTQIGQNQRIHTDFIQRRQIFGQLQHFLIPGQCVNRHIDLHAPFMAITDSFLHFLRRKVSGGSSHSIGLSCQINRVSAVGYGKTQFLHITGRRQNFRAAHQLYFPAATSAIARLCSSLVRLKM